MYSPARQSNGTGTSNGFNGELNIIFDVNRFFPREGEGDSLRSDMLKELQKDINLYEDYLNLINKNNIPAKLIKKKNLYIEEHINTFLENLVQFKIEIESDIKNGIHFYAKKKGLVLDINQLSGYETFILNIALKSALRKYSFISKSTALKAWVSGCLKSLM